MRIWDIDPGYLSRQRLLAEYRELHGVHTVVTEARKGYRHHPETLRWAPFINALRFRHLQLVSEMSIRGYRNQSPLPGPVAPVSWPTEFIDSPRGQLQILDKKYANLETGRIPLPKNNQQLWAQHKYSVMARSTKHYKEIGVSVSRPKNGPSQDSLLVDLVSQLRTQAPWPRARNSLAHMWGYVSQYAETEQVADMQDWLQEKPRRALAYIRKLATEHKVTYLLHSTALGELMCHLPEALSDTDPCSAE